MATQYDLTVGEDVYWVRKHQYPDCIVEKFVWFGDGGKAKLFLDIEYPALISNVTYDHEVEIGSLLSWGPYLDGVDNNHLTIDNYKAKTPPYYFQQLDVL